MTTDAAAKHAKTVQEMLNYPFRSGWLEADLRNTRRAMERACVMLDDVPRAELARILLEERIEIIDDTLALIREANAVIDESNAAATAAIETRSAS